MDAIEQHSTIKITSREDAALVLIIEDNDHRMEVTVRFNEIRSS